MTNETKNPNVSASGSVITPVASTYLPNVAGAVKWQAEIKNGRIDAISISHNRVNARFNVGQNGVNSYEFSENGKTYRIDFGDENGG